MKTLVDDFLSTHVETLKSELKRLDEIIPADAFPQPDNHLQQLRAILDSANTACKNLQLRIEGDAELLQATRTRFQEALSPWFDTSGSLSERSRTKPRGYAGDYQLLTAIYDHEIVARGLPGYVDLYLIELLLVKSIRSRWQHMREFLIEELSSRCGDVSVLNVASGACREFAEPFELRNRCDVRLQCLDNDPAALDFVRMNVVPGSDINSFSLSRYNALRLKSSKATIRNFGTFDIVYSIGLVDYIPDEPLIEILRGLRACLNANGVAYINFKDSDRYDEVPYQWFLDWHFFQRTESDCMTLFAAAGYDVENMEVTRDGTGVIMNFSSRVGDESIRVDVAEVVRPTAIRYPSVTKGFPQP